MNTGLKKVVAVLLAITMLVSVMSTAVFAAEVQAPENSEYLNLVLDEEQIATISEGGESAYFSFTPEEDGIYVFKAYATDDTIASF